MRLLQNLAYLSIKCNCMKVEIVKVSDKKQKKQFIDFPHELYKDDPLYVPELYLAQNEMMDTKKYPLFEFSTVNFFLAKKEGEIVGRIAAIHNKNYNEYHKANAGFFGFFDIIDDYEVSEALLSQATEDLKEKGLTEIIGPCNYSTNETAGLLVDGFDRSPIVMMTYNKPYYADHLEKHGFKKSMDLYAYMIWAKNVSEKAIRIANALEERLKRSGITIRNIDLKNLKAEVENIKPIYNAAWQDNWGFVPFTDREINHLADSLKMIADSRWLYVAEENGKVIGFNITLPDINEITRTFKKGRLFPFNVIKLLMKKKKTKFVRIIALGVLEEYRKKGIEAIFFAKNIQTARETGVVGGEASWVLESNEMMVKAAENLNGERYKTYRLYNKFLS